VRSNAWASIRSTAGVLALLALVLALAGCGGGDDETTTGRDEDFAKYSSADVQKRFKELTGGDLRRNASGSESLETLSLPFGGSSSENDGLRDRYGGFIVLVTGNKTALEAITKRPPQGGRKVIDNVVIEGTGSSTGAEGFERAAQIFSSLGKPASSVKLPPEETPCEKAGIDPDGGAGKEGVCKGADQKTLTIANSDSPLKVKGRTLSGLRVKRGKIITSRRFGLIRRFRAKGGFIAASVKVANTGDEPLSSLRPNLVIDGKSYSEDDRGSIYVNNPESFPIQPGDSARVVVLFDVPVAAARKAVSKGALEISGDPETTSVEFSETIGRLRLKGAERGPPPKGRRGVVS